MYMMNIRARSTCSLCHGLGASPMVTCSPSYASSEVTNSLDGYFANSLSANATNALDVLSFPACVNTFPL